MLQKALAGEEVFKVRDASKQNGRSVTLPHGERLNVVSGAADLYDGEEITSDSERCKKWPANVLRGHRQNKTSDRSRRGRQEARSPYCLQTQLPHDQLHGPGGVHRRQEGKGWAYDYAHYRALLAYMGAFMHEPWNMAEVRHRVDDVCQTLLEAKSTMPRWKLYHDEAYWMASCHRWNKTEARVIRSIMPLMLPSFQRVFTGKLATRCAILMECVNEFWTASVLLVGIRPQPDYSVGFRRSAFSAEQLAQLDPYLGRVNDETYFAATVDMFFPFLTCEVAATMELAERQNAHSMAIAVTGVVELFRLVGRHRMLHGETLGFSMSISGGAVRLNGHFALLQGDYTSCFQTCLYSANFDDAAEILRWVPYRFTKTMMQDWMPKHYRRICCAINALPTSERVVDQRERRAYCAAAGPSRGSSELGLDPRPQRGFPSRALPIEAILSVPLNPWLNPDPACYDHLYGVSQVGSLDG
ncbi:MAG: hypothetical protein M1825_004547 [Sarcosagium campestre]|nr:MAG: hypothetical protein M1825_004547 [Sarcosagium campestre]